jgi:6-phosphogluconolactonase
MRATVRTLRDLESVSRAAADELAELAAGHVGTFRIALSGGSTPKRLFQILAERGPRGLPWERIELYWGDERCVAPDHADSNYAMTKANLLDPLGLDPARVHRIRGEDPDPAAAASAYAAELAPLAPEGGGFPEFDYVMLGLGSDGHTASLFPGSPALDAVGESFVANAVDSPLTRGKTTRLTITASTINWGRHVRFLVAGADKADAAHEVLEGAANHRRYPAQLVRPIHGTLAWLIDEAAAARLGGRA